jgi:hypothetical protein
MKRQLDSDSTSGEESQKKSKSKSKSKSTISAPSSTPSTPTRKPKILLLRHTPPPQKNSKKSSQKSSQSQSSQSKSKPKKNRSHSSSASSDEPQQSQNSKKKLTEDQLKAKLKKQKAKRKELGYIKSASSFTPKYLHLEDDSQCGPRWNIILSDINQFVVPRLCGANPYWFSTSRSRRQVTITRANLSPTHLMLLFYDSEPSIIDHLIRTSFLKKKSVDPIPRSLIYAYFAARQAQQLAQTFTKDDSWASNPDPFAASPVYISKIISKTDYYKCQKQLGSFDVKYVNEVFNLNKYWLPFPHLCLDDKADDYKGKHPAKTYRPRKPKPHCLLGYALADSRCYRVSYFPRFPPYAQLTSQYLQYKQMWKDYYEDLSNQTPRPLSWKKQFNSQVSKTSFPLPEFILNLLSYLPVARGSHIQTQSIFNPNLSTLTQLGKFSWHFYDVTMDREFGTEQILNTLRGLPGLGFFLFIYLFL